MSFKVKQTHHASDTFKLDSNFYGGDKALSGNRLVDLAPSIEKIAARAGAPVRHVDVQSPNAPPASLSEPIALEKVAMAIAPPAMGHLYQKPDPAELAQFGNELRQRIDSKLLEHQFNFSWMPEPVTLGQAYSKLGVSTPMDFLHKISAEDPQALELGFRPRDRTFIKDRIDEAEAQAAQEVALEIVDGRVASSPIEWGSKERVASMLQSLGVASRYELKLRMNDPQTMQRLGQFNVAKAMSVTKARERAAIDKLERDLKKLDSNTAQLVENGLTLGLLNRARAAKNAEFVKDFSARPEGDRLTFLTKYLHRQYGVRGERHSALDNPDILRFVEGSLSSEDRNTFINLFRARKSPSQGQDNT